MESKQFTRQNHLRKACHEKELTDVMNRLGEIDQKIEHIIENIHDSLYRMRETPEGDKPEVFQ